jgi:hypothetical protein
VKDGQSVEKEVSVNGIHIMELLFQNSLVKFYEDLQGQSFMVEIDEQTGFKKSNF